MKKKALYSLLIMLVIALASTSAYSAEKYSLGMGNVALKVDYINFTEDAFDDIDLDNGVYVGLEGYYAVYPNLYLGLEAGWAGTENDGDLHIGGLGSVDVDIDVTYVPVELNLKYAFDLAPEWNMGIGAGICYSYFEIEANDINASEDDWVFGGQVFADLNYKMSKEWFLGINAKYQITEDLEFDDYDTDTSADNFRVGAQIGLMF